MSGAVATTAGSEPAVERTHVAILDYGMGNLRSVEKALERIGARAEITADPERAAVADGLILPGVGAFPKAMERVRELGHDELVRERAAAGSPVLGICLGMQLLFERSEELGGSDGIGVLAGEVRPLRADGLKVPHIGWSPVRWQAESPLCAGLGDETPFYFVHTFAAGPARDADVIGSAEYGERFAAVVGTGSVTGAQFHPEKSSAAGLAMLRNFVTICSS